MYILGDIGNSDTKVFLVNSKQKIVKNIILPSKKINNKILNSKFKYLIKNFNSIEKILFCSGTRNLQFNKKFFIKKNK